MPHERGSTYQDHLEPTLDRKCYVDPAWFQEERLRLFHREWFCAGRAVELDARGAYRVVDLCGESVLLVRDEDGALRGYHNVCRHRGSQLVFHESGEELDGCFKGGIRCPYHSWNYRLDGRLHKAPHLTLGQDGFNLHPVEVDIWGGFMFVRTVPGGPALLESLGAIPGRVKNYPLEVLRVGKRITYHVAANWKVVLENYNECYHCAGVHPELCKIVPAFREGGGAGLDWDEGIPHHQGATTFTFSGTTDRAPFPGLSEKERTRHKGELIYPNMMLSLCMDHVAAYTLWPRSPDRTDIICELLFHPDEMPKAEFDPSDAADFWDLVNRQDWQVCESVQRGMSSRVFRHGYYAPMEDLSLDIRNYVRERLS